MADRLFFQHIREAICALFDHQFDVAMGAKTRRCRRCGLLQHWIHIELPEQHYFSGGVHIHVAATCRDSWVSDCYFHGAGKDGQA